MSKCRYDLSEDCNNTDCLNCVLDKLKAEIENIEISGMVDANTMYVRSAGQIKNIVIETIDKYRQERI